MNVNIIKLAQNINTSVNSNAAKDIEAPITHTINAVYYSLLAIIPIWFLYLIIKMVNSALKVKNKNDVDKNKKIIRKSFYRMLTVLALALVVFVLHFALTFTTG